MKSRIFMYLFICAALIALWQFTSAKNYAEVADKKIKSLRAKTEKLKDSVAVLHEDNIKLAGFTLANDELGLEYFADHGYEKVIQLLEDRILDTNSTSKSHPLVPYEMMDNNPFTINSIKVLNHRWIIADFTDGKVWGQVLIKYFVNDDKSVDFEPVESLIYPQ